MLHCVTVLINVHLFETLLKLKKYKFYFSYSIYLIKLVGLKQVCNFTATQDVVDNFQEAFFNNLKQNTNEIRIFIYFAKFILSQHCQSRNITI